MIGSVLLAAIMSTALASPLPGMQDTRTDEPGGRMEQADSSVRFRYQPGVFRDDGEGDSLALVRKPADPPPSFSARSWLLAPDPTPSLRSPNVPYV